jgi:DNA (cytosine-5)-methyltransferase 1
MKYIDLFAGTGAFSHVLKQKNFECVFANDMIRSSKDIYNLNHQNHPFMLEDLHNISVETIPSFDILCAGFSCQPFSIAGKREGFKDQRSNVFWKLIEIIKFHKPSILLLENVKNLKTHDNGNTIKTILSSLEKLNYHVKYEILDTSKLTVIPQHRERIYIVAFLNKDVYQKFNFNFPTQKNYPIKDYLETNVPSKYYYTEKLQVFPIIKKDVIKSVYTFNTVYQYRRHYVRENKKQHCPTLTANMGGGGHNVPIILDDIGIRKLTPRECFNLQGFPSNYILPNISDSSLYKLAGNSVSIPIVELIVEALMKCI